MSFNQDGANFLLNDKPLQFSHQFIYLGITISSTESDVNICIVKAWAATKKLSTIWKSELSDKTKRKSSRAVAESVLLYG